MKVFTLWQQGKLSGIFSDIGLAEGAARLSEFAVDYNICPAVLDRIYLENGEIIDVKTEN